MKPTEIRTALIGKQLTKLVGSGGMPPTQPPREVIVRHVVMHLMDGDRVVFAGSSTYSALSLIVLGYEAGTKGLGDGEEPIPLGAPWDSTAGLIEDVRCTEEMVSPPPPRPLPEPTADQAAEGWTYDPEIAFAEDVLEYTVPLGPMQATTRVAVRVAGHGWLLFEGSPAHPAINAHRLTRMSRADSLTE